VINNIPDASTEPLATLLRKVEEAGFPDTSEFYPAALILFCGTLIGTDEHQIAKVTGLVPEVVNQIADRLRHNGLWRDEGVAYGDWSNPERRRGEICLMLDLMVATGDLVRTGKVRNGHYVYARNKDRHC
jgi:hypothetical protein